MADSTSSARIHLDITVCGYLLTREMVRHLCVLKYGFTTDQLNGMSSIDCATLYYARRYIMESPRLLDLVHKKTETRWLLVGGAAFFRTGTTPPRLVLDAEIKAYLDHWFPPDLHHRDEFKGMRYVQILWPDNVIPYGIVRHKMNMRSKKYREEWREDRRKWIAEEKAKGVTEFVTQIKLTLDEELQHMHDIVFTFLKTYQVWHHRRLLLTVLNSVDAAARELGFLKAPRLWPEERAYAEELLEEDVRNNSAWHHRFFVVFSSGVRAGDEDREQVLRRELPFAKEKMSLAPNNPSARNYLRGTLEHANTPLAVVQPFVEPYTTTQPSTRRQEFINLARPGSALGCIRE
ncbi:hypothetical protein C8Q74DRAFT_1372311 [Fomes fomentarius]|nr:hypothetical protein C8Q74DRAFT_1372311 [Fomes fomentarius]